MKAIKEAESPIEKILYYELKKLGIKCELQYWIKGIRLDIAIPQIKLGIECDGKEYHQDELKDEARDRACYKQGWIIERYTGSDIYLFANSIAVDIGRRWHLLKGVDDYDRYKKITIDEDKCLIF